jgi:hypothetical protein
LNDCSREAGAFKRAQVFSLFTDNYLKYSPSEKCAIEICWKNILRHEMGKIGETR